MLSVSCASRIVSECIPYYDYVVDAIVRYSVNKLFVIVVKCCGVFWPVFF